MNGTMSSNSTLAHRSLCAWDTGSQDSAVITQEYPKNEKVALLEEGPHAQLSLRSEVKGKSARDITSQTPVDLSKAVRSEPEVKRCADEHPVDKSAFHAMDLMAQDLAIISVGKPLGFPDSGIPELASSGPQAANRNEVVIAIGSPASETAKKPRFKALASAQERDAAVRRANLAGNHPYHVTQAFAFPGPNPPQKPLNPNAAPFIPKDQGQKKATKQEQAHMHALVEGLRHSTRLLGDSQ